MSVAIDTRPSSDSIIARPDERARRLHDLYMLLTQILKSVQGRLLSYQSLYLIFKLLKVFLISYKQQKMKSGGAGPGAHI